MTNSWCGGFQLGFTVTNSGTAPTTGWNVRLLVAGVADHLADLERDGDPVRRGGQRSANLSYNGAIPAGGSTTFGLLGSGSRTQRATGPEMHRALTGPARYPGFAGRAGRNPVRRGVPGQRRDSVVSLNKGGSQ